MAKKMNKNQKSLYKALEVISNGVLFLEDALSIVEKMTKQEVKDVIERFSDEITEFDERELYQNAYDFEGYTQEVLSKINMKIGG